MKKNIALITGATSGIGYEIAKLLAAKKYDLCLVSRKQDTLEVTKAALEKEFGVDVVLYAADLSTNGAAKRVYDMVQEKGYTIEILVNNAGFGAEGLHTEIPVEKVHSMIGLNITALTELSHYIGGAMKTQKHGYILNVASTAAYQPLPYMAAYAASKSYVLNFSEALAKELEDFGVVVTALSPGMTATKFFTEMGVGENTDGIFDKRRRMSAEDVAEIGVDALFRKKLSVISGYKNKCLAWGSKIVPRAVVAAITKRMMRQ
ncbi:MAG: short-chain dehydrogenase [Candidatus Magasanikbacteria bacterium CG10_big_fil_rev_8_21_14_0_10_43_6]|uniref:Short-chain dehydrogenase n=1 Tax=Candidatus Magasanikbacteria bacterium CG10_big_fil_rev_8_21_14_0_10_43_6 TaxID=1974650 RepID=A0A2M6VZX5_9BACT|nr:MAG: short-chain dehydrogenase [Candidatus Magasanikbacteria bacterium CG10_big_fil_rev_8_21_14_0_10_43_6]